MHVAIYGRAFNEKFSPYVEKLFVKLKEKKISFSIYLPFFEYLSSRVKMDKNVTLFSSYEEIKGKTDFIFSIGGDGTFLESTTFVRSSEIPVMGINTGRMGFLSSFAIDEIDVAMEAIVNKTYTLDQRTMLRLDTPDKLFGDANFALNEITIHKKDTSAMIIIHAHLDGKFLNSYWADGLIISTPTGSTAYSLSCGGPIVLPDCGNFVISPIAPHNLNVRPIVVSDKSKIKLRVEGRSQSFLVSLDSRSETIHSDIELTVSKNNFNVTLLRPAVDGQLNTIRNKLNWGFDKRN